MKFHASILVTASTAALLSACGGSGDSSSSSGTKTVAITATNQSDVARAAVNAGFSLALVQDETGNGSTASPTAAVAAERALQYVLREAVGQRRSVASANAHPEAGSTRTDPCGVSGTVTSTWNDVDGSGQLSAGDVLSANFQQCQESTALSINGALSITLTGTPTATQFAANVAFQNVVVVYAGVTYTMTGGVALAEVDTTTVSSSTFTVGTAGLTVAIASAGYADSVAFDAGMTVSSTFLAGTSSLTLTGSFVAQSIGGRVTIATPNALYTQVGSTYPSQGQVLITGASGSTLLATVLNVSQVQLQVDANGDGTVDGTTTVAWASLIP